MARLEKIAFALGLAFLLIGAIKPAAATTQTFELTFGASDFTDQIGSATPPVTSVLGKLTFSLDLDHDSTGTAKLDFLNLSQGTIGFQYFSGIAGGGMFIGGLPDGVVFVSSTEDDLELGVTNLRMGTPGFAFLRYSQASTPGSIFHSGDGAVHVETAGVAATPVPPALPLFVSALGGLGVLGWRRRNAAG